MEPNQALKIGALSLLLSQAACSGILKPSLSNSPDAHPTASSTVQAEFPPAIKPSVIIPTPTLTADQYDYRTITQSAGYQMDKENLEKQGKPVKLYEIPPNSRAITTNEEGSKVRKTFILDKSTILLNRPFLQWDPVNGYPCRYLVGVGDPQSTDYQLWAYISDVFIKEGTRSPGPKYYSDYNKDDERSAWAVAKLGQVRYLRFENFNPPFGHSTPTEIPWDMPKG